VISGAAAGIPNVKALVYMAAFAPEAGEAVAAFLEQYPSLLGSGVEEHPLLVSRDDGRQCHQSRS